MVEIGGYPILWHIMKIYARFNFTNFYCALGYKSELIKEYFYKQRILNSDFSIDLSSGNINCDEYNWQWDGNSEVNSNGDLNVYNLESSGWYYLYVTDSYGCEGYDSIYVVVGVLPYDAITPNNDGYNDTWSPIDIEQYENALVQVFNRWGGLVFESVGGEQYNPWDGTNNCLLYTSPSPRDLSTSRMPSSA